MKRDLLLFARVAARDGDYSRRDVAAAELDAQRRPLQLPLVAAFVLIVIAAWLLVPAQAAVTAPAGAHRELGLAH